MIIVFKMSAVEFGAGVSSDASPIREKTAGVNLEQTKSNELALGEVAVDPKFAKRTLYVAHSLI